jgi:hypothetical protein
MGIKKRHAMVTDRREWRKIVLEAKVDNGEKEESIYALEDTRLHFYKHARN